MHLKINHRTHYTFEQPILSGLQQLRVTPKVSNGQKILNWKTTITGGESQLTFDDHHNNHVELVSLNKDMTEITIDVEGEVYVEDKIGIVGPHHGPAPLWLYMKPTAHTKPGPGCNALIKQVSAGSDLERLHQLSAIILEAVKYKSGMSDTDWTAEDAISQAVGVCQDHTHIFSSCARKMGFPARYVSGYLMMEDRVDQDATHAWSEAHIPDLGWVGFDVSNGIAPDGRYVRMATGLDYTEAAPVIGTRVGGAEEALSVAIQVAQQ